MVGCRASALCYRGNRLAAIDLSAVAREIRGSDAVVWSDSRPRASAGVRGPPTPPPFYMGKTGPKMRYLAETLQAN